MQPIVAASLMGNMNIENPSLFLGIGVVFAALTVIWLIVLTRKISRTGAKNETRSKIEKNAAADTAPADTMSANTATDTAMSATAMSATAMSANATTANTNTAAADATTVNAGNVPDGALIAAVTAAIRAYTGGRTGSFRVVSFKER